ncbi:hypothetical protein H112_01553 [Trichophyton rubrum D6]|uniref:Uncharacterized protein n=3 Tax=Trichophyton rubrum TaxID=5551 RepID=A0A178F7L2_TRIRU|nr:uncharacterized protein TERG_07190 [Trichophyton rubrum CBS 118892]EZF26344.1 hypothetical protein H100_01548 [Trichophyton rubrum MR850]EZF45378.1 hypothetical protein H102_01544 [Trichophyton rubrum CBS 100081]EZF55927.1 hypothetical protein H103_01557 [Trichophyton rubrum CBS 288.86]EZF66626.1 hypothetical protein H104_01533 [Trichophyton rubrum CBS 289.86]EZF87924.1 hypothetical protein H110_01552 [Trichophyton rubrum MR1448]EZF98707.1 hypothetical protein H113_01556 [Trichophyton rubr
MTNQKDLGYGWLAKAKFEQDKLLKEKSDTWKVARWQAYWEDVRKGTVKRMVYLVLITKSGPITSPEKLQEIAGLTSPPEVYTTVKMKDFGQEPPAEPREEEKVQYCTVGNLQAVKAATYGVHQLVWFRDAPLGAWLAYSLKADDRQWEDFREACRTGTILYTQGTYPIIISNAGPFTSPEKLQEMLGLSAPPELKKAARAELSEDMRPWPKEGDLMQYCDVDLCYLDKVEEVSEGEDILIWANRKKRCGWLANSLKSKLWGEDVDASNGKEKAARKRTSLTDTDTD